LELNDNTIFLVRNCLINLPNNAIKIIKAPNREIGITRKAPIFKIICNTPFDTMSENDFYIGLKSKLMGQVIIVRVGQNYLNAGGSFTLTTGILADHPVFLTSSAAMVNGGIHSFVKAVSLELRNGYRINVVSSGLVEDAVEKYEEYFPGHNHIPMRKVINGYVKSIEGKETGKIIRIYDNC
jgi:hypothetical protein